MSGTLSEGWDTILPLKTPSFGVLLMENTVSGATPESTISVQLNTHTLNLLCSFETPLLKSLRSLLLVMVAKIIGNWALLYVALSMMMLID
jgi:hypothetical protein